MAAKADGVFYLIRVGKQSLNDFYSDDIQIDFNVIDSLQDYIINNNQTNEILNLFSGVKLSDQHISNNSIIGKISGVNDAQIYVFDDEAGIIVTLGGDQ